MARSLGEWWDKLAEQSPYAVARMLAGAALLRLDKPVSEAEPDARLAAAAVPSFARALGVPVPRTGCSSCPIGGCRCWYCTRQR